MKQRSLYIVVFFISALFACVKQKQQQNSFNFKPPTVIEAKAYKVAVEETAPPVVIPATGVKKVAAGKPEITQLKSNAFPAITESIIQARKPEVIIPGGGNFEPPEVVPAVDSPFKAGSPEIIFLKDYYIKENNPESFSSIKAMYGLNSDEISSLCQDEAGNLWIGTWYGGVSKYDGRFLSNYYTEQGLNSDIVSCVFGDKNSNIWIGTADAGVNKFDGKYITRYSVKEGISNNFIRNILQDKNGNIWFATHGGLNKFDGHSFTHYTTSQGLPSNTIVSMLEDSKGNLWVGGQAGLVRFDGHSFQNYTVALNLNDTAIVSTILEDRKGNIWFAANTDGLFKYDGKYIAHYTTKSSLISNDISKIIEDNNGDIWIATWDKGINRFNGKSFIHLGTEQGLPGEVISSILLDKHNNLWIATPAGICQYQGKLFRHITTEQGLSKEDVTSLTYDRHGNLWVGTWGAGISKCDGKSIARYTTAHGLINDYTSAILEDAHGNIWFGTSGPGKNKHGGAAKYDGSSFTHYFTSNGLIHSDVYCMLEDSKGSIWFGTPQGLSKFDGQNFTNYLTKQGLSSNAVFSLLEDHNGMLWVGTGNNGVCTFDGASFTHYDIAHSLSNPTILGMIEDKDNNIWFCTSKGVNKFDGKYFTWYTTEQGLSNNIVKNLFEDKNGNIWVGTLNGMNRFMPRGTNTGAFFKKYTISEGFLGGGAYENSISGDADGRIWMGANDRITSYHPEGDIPDTIPPTIQLSNVMLFDEAINWLGIEEQKDSVLILNNGTKLKNFKFSALTPWHNQPQNLELEYNNNYIKIQFIGITTNRPKEVRYQYFLEGLDEQWSALTDKPEAIYNNLPYGKYNFKVKAMNSEGYWSKELSYAFTIRPPWWRTWWFQLIAAVFIIASIYALIRWRFQQKLRLRLERSKNEKQVAELQQQKTELEMQALRAQMNPHFIFNSLNSINNFILQRNSAQASGYLTKFSRLIRLILQNSQGPLITLESEVEALQLYLELEMLRFDDHFVFKIFVDKELDTEIIKIPPLIIQPFAENAIWHGLMHKEDKGHLQIELFQQDEMLCCRITDDGIGRKKAEALNHKPSSMHQPMGLRITEERIAMLQQQKQIKSSVDITDLVLPDGTAGGTEVLLRIPLIINSRPGG